MEANAVRRTDRHRCLDALTSPWPHDGIEGEPSSESACTSFASEHGWFLPEGLLGFATERWPVGRHGHVDRQARPAPALHLRRRFVDAGHHKLSNVKSYYFLQ